MRGASAFCPRGFDPQAVDDHSVPEVRLHTATNEAVVGDVGKRSHFTVGGNKRISVRYNEADVNYPTTSLGEATQNGNWFVFGPTGQAMFSGMAAEKLEEVLGLPKAVGWDKDNGYTG